jgi:hypothetical protein
VAAPIEDLIKAETKLSRSFVACVMILAANIIWTFFLARRGPNGVAEPVAVTLVLSLVQLGLYVWYAVSAGAAAKALGSPAWKYVVWVLVAPLLAQLPIPIVSTLIGASPLSIKLLLGGQLQTAIRQESTAALH